MRDCGKASRPQRRASKAAQVVWITILASLFFGFLSSPPVSSVPPPLFPLNPPLDSTSLSSSTCAVRVTKENKPLPVSLAWTGPLGKLAPSGAGLYLHKDYLLTVRKGIHFERLSASSGRMGIASQFDLVPEVAAAVLASRPESSTSSALGFSGFLAASPSSARANGESSSLLMSAWRACAASCPDCLW